MSRDHLPEIEVSLAAWGDRLDPIRFSRETGLVPGSVTRKGEPRPSGRGVYPFSTWALSVAETNDNTDEVVRKLLDVLRPNADALRGVAARREFSIEIVCRVRIQDSSPALDLGPDTLAELAGLGCRVLFDVYDYSDLGRSI